MPLDFKCSKCGNPITNPGGIVLSPPIINGGVSGAPTRHSVLVWKDHLCQRCHMGLFLSADAVQIGDRWKFHTTYHAPGKGTHPWYPDEMVTVGPEWTGQHARILLDNATLIERNGQPVLVITDVQMGGMCNVCKIHFETMEGLEGHTCQ